MIILLISIVIILIEALVVMLVINSSFKTDEERYLEDIEQMEYLKIIKK